MFLCPHDLIIQIFKFLNHEINVDKQTVVIIYVYNIFVRKKGFKEVLLSE